MIGVIECSDVGIRGRYLSRCKDAEGRVIENLAWAVSICESTV